MSFTIVEIKKRKIDNLVFSSWGQLQHGLFCHSNIIGLNGATLNKVIGISLGILLVDGRFVVALGFEC